MVEMENGQGGNEIEIIRDIRVIRGQKN